MRGYSVEEQGEGKPILFLHGFLSRKESFYYQTSEFKKTARTVAVDLPGFGDTPEPLTGYSLDGYVDFVREVIDARCGGRADIVAHSFGGRIALKLAAILPEKTDRLLLVGCAGMKPHFNPVKCAKKATYRVVKRFFPEAKSEWERRLSSPDYLALSPVMRESFKKVVNENLEYILPEISCPTLIVCGDRDGETPPYMARRLKAGIKGSGLVFMKDCGHFCFSQSPEQFNEIMRGFFF